MLDIVVPHVSPFLGGTFSYSLHVHPLNFNPPVSGTIYLCQAKSYLILAFFLGLFTWLQSQMLWASFINSLFPKETSSFFCPPWSLGWAVLPSHFPASAVPHMTGEFLLSGMFLHSSGSIPFWTMCRILSHFFKILQSMKVCENMGAWPTQAGGDGGTFLKAKNTPWS